MRSSLAKIPNPSDYYADQTRETTKYTNTSLTARTAIVQALETHKGLRIKPHTNRYITSSNNHTLKLLTRLRTHDPYQYLKLQMRDPRSHPLLPSNLNSSSPWRLLFLVCSLNSRQ